MSVHQVEEVPTLAQAGSSSLPTGALAYLNLRSAVDVVVGAVVLAGVLAWLLSGTLRTVLLAALGGLTLISLCVELPVLNRLRVRYTSYSATPHFVYIRRGALFRSSVFLPTRQILNVETVQGPFLRRFGYVNVRFKCITDVETLGPLDPAAVVHIRRAIAAIEPAGRAVAEPGAGPVDPACR